MLGRVSLQLSILSVLLGGLGVSTALACKERNYPDVLPADEITRYVHIALVTVSKVNAQKPDGRYAPPFMFEAKVVETFRGNLKQGTVISGATSANNEPHAACPIAMTQGQTYLVFLNGKESPYELPRYGTLYLASNDSRFAQYISQLRGMQKPTPQ